VQENIKMLLLDELLAAMDTKETSLIKSLSKKANISIIVIDHNYTSLRNLRSHQRDTAWSAQRFDHYDRA